MKEKTKERNLPKDVSDKEFIGRRAFGSKIFEKIHDGNIFRITVFMDRNTKMSEGISVDRLGLKTVSCEILDYLLPQADNMALKRGTTFAGWAQIKVSDLKSLSGVYPTDAVGEENPYHAEIDISQYNHSNNVLRSFAFSLCVLAARYEFIYRPS